MKVVSHESIKEFKSIKLIYFYVQTFLKIIHQQVQARGNL